MKLDVTEATSQQQDMIQSVTAYIYQWSWQMGRVAPHHSKVTYLTVTM